jgi:tetratricopeptide (TPR) repeat protein
MLTPNFKAQKQWYESILKKDAKNFKALYGLALTYHNEGAIEEAINIYKKIM